MANAKLGSLKMRPEGPNLPRTGLHRHLHLHLFLHCHLPWNFSFVCNCEYVFNLLARPCPSPSFQQIYRQCPPISQEGDAKKEKQVLVKTSTTDINGLFCFDLFDSTIWVKMKFHKSIVFVETFCCCHKCTLQFILVC